MIDVDAMLAAAVQAPPCGPDLEYDAEYRELEELARGKEEKRSGDTVIAAEPPRWPEVADKAAALLLRSKDLRLACLLLRARVQLDGLAGLAPGVRLLHGLLEQYWDGVHPVLDAEDHNDPTMRLNALAPLTNPSVLLRELRDVVVLRSRQHGPVRVRDVEIALNKLPARSGGTALTQAQLESVLAAAPADDAAVMPAVDAAIAALTALSAQLDSRFGAARAPDLKPLLATLHTLVQVLPRPASAVPLPAPLPTLMVSEAPAAPRTDGEPGGAVRSRQDALLLIDKVIEYLEANEPSSPVPILLKRCKRFMNMSFVDIVKEIAPDSIDKLELIVGPQDAAP